MGEQKVDPSVEAFDGTTTGPAELERLARQVDELHDIEQIKQLQARFWLACDGDFVRGPTHDPVAITDLFTEDGSWVIRALDVEGASWPEMWADGRDELLAWFTRSQANVPFSMHVGAAPVIEVDRPEAQGTWKLLGLITTAERHALWAGAIYHVRYLLTVNGWRIKEASVTVGFNTPFDTGWGALRFVPLARHQLVGGNGGREAVK
jgi:hypothetical protein